MITVNWADVTASVIVLCIGGLVAGAWCFIESRRIAAEEDRQRRAFDQEMAVVELPDWNGDTYDWTRESLAYLDDTHLYAGPGIADTTSFEAVPDEPVPPSEISGPLPVMDGSDDFIARLRAENTAFLEELDGYAPS